MTENNSDTVTHADLSPLDNIFSHNPENIIIDSWDRKHQYLQINSDYSDTNFIEAINNQNRLNLVVPLLVDTQESVFPVLNQALDLVINLDLDKIILHLICDTEIDNLWQSFVSKYLATTESLGEKLVLGSISDKSYALNEDQDYIKLALALRVILDPKVAASNNSLETIDGYFKGRFNSRYYENYDIYTESDLLEFESQDSISKQLKLVLAKSYNEKIFPVDIRTNSLQKYDVIWYLDSVKINFDNLIKLHQEVDLEYSLNQTIISNFLIKP